jgi:hypothetical protein
VSGCPLTYSSSPQHPAHGALHRAPLRATLAENIIAPAEGKVKALQNRRRLIEAELIKPE